MWNLYMSLSVKKLQQMPSKGVVFHWWLTKLFGDSYHLQSSKVVYWLVQSLGMGQLGSIQWSLWVPSNLRYSVIL